MRETPEKPSAPSMKLVAKRVFWLELVAMARPLDSGSPLGSGHRSIHRLPLDPLIDKTSECGMMIDPFRSVYESIPAHPRGPGPVRQREPCGLRGGADDPGGDPLHQCRSRPSR